jgi:DNA-directed RNA polymerase specialized sigma24 family protein
VVNIKGYSEEEVLTILDKVLTSIARKYTFGIYSIDDIKQEGFIIAYEKILPKYDGSAPLENFLRKSLGNRLKNFKRDMYVRLKPSCSTCDNFNEDCPDCLKREQSQETKKNLLNPIDINALNDDQGTTYEGSLIDTLEMVEVIDRINKKLPVEYREDYLRIKDGAYISKSRREEIERIVMEIVENNE